MSIQSTVGCNIRILRKQAGLSQEKLAQMAGMHRTYLCNIERGSINTSIGKIARIASALNVEIFSIFSSAANITIPTALQKSSPYILCERTDCGFNFYPIKIDDFPISLQLIAILSEQGFKGPELIRRYYDLESRIFASVNDSLELLKTETIPRPFKAQKPKNRNLCKI